MKESKESSFLNRELTRREASLEILAFLGLAAAITHMGYEYATTPQLETYQTHFASVDFGPSSWWREKLYQVTQPYRPNNISLQQRLLGDEYEPTTALAGFASSQYVNHTLYGSPDTVSREQASFVEGIVDESLRGKPVPTLVWIAEKKFGPHATDMVTHKKGVLRELGLRPDHHYIVPIQRNVHSVPNEHGRRLWEDEDGRPGTRLHFDAYGTLNDIKQYAGSYGALAIPLQFGDVDMFYEPDVVSLPEKSLIENLMRKIKIVGAYERSRAYESLLPIAEIISELEILGIFALGNTDVDYTVEAVEKLRREGKWPEEYIIQAGEVLPYAVEKVDDTGNTSINWGYKSWYGSYGSPNDTIFVDNDTIGHDYGSSAAVWTTAIYADMLLRRGVKVENIKETIFDSAVHTKDVEDREINVIPNVDLLRQAS